jgi:uncharacterized Fe-S cluster-containing radical SAM superfamily protein
MVREYPRFLKSGFKPFDPLELARETERLVTREGPEGLERKYTAIYSAPVYGGIATGYAAGCCLRCIYCWTGWSRDFPEHYGKFYSPGEAASRLFKATADGITSPRWKRFKHLKVDKLRVSGCEPTLGKQHLLELLEHVAGSDYPFFLETNGIVLGADRDYVRRLSRFSKFLYVRVSFKAALPGAFTARTGAIGESCELPFKALECLLEEGIYARAAAMTDPEVMPSEERDILIRRLESIDPGARYADSLEEEEMDAYAMTKKRLRAFSDPEYALHLEKEALGLSR